MSYKVKLVNLQLVGCIPGLLYFGLQLDIKVINIVVSFTLILWPEFSTHYLENISLFLFYYTVYNYIYTVQVTIY